MTTSTQRRSLPRPSWRQTLTGALLSVTTAAVVTSQTNSASAPTPQDAAATSGHVMFGLDNDNRPATEAAQGRTFAVVRIYRGIGDPILDSTVNGIINSGRSTVLSISPGLNGNHVPLTDIAAGKYDRELGAQLDAYNGIAQTPYFIFDHEPNNSDEAHACPGGTGAGCAPAFVAAWRHVHDLAQRRGDTRLVWSWTMMAYTYRTDYNGINAWFPGAAYVDWIGVDAYPANCTANNGSEDLTDQLRSSLTWRNANAPSLPMMIPEWGAPSATDALRAAWINDLHAALKTPEWSPLQAMMYWNSDAGKCQYTLNTSAGSFAAWKAMANDPWFGRRPGAGPKPTPTPTSRPTPTPTSRPRPTATPRPTPTATPRPTPTPTPTPLPGLTLSAPSATTVAKADFRIGVTLNHAATLTIDIADRAGHIVRHRIVSQSVPSGRFTVDYLGQNDAGNQVPAGSYVAVIAASDASGHLDLVTVGFTVA